MTFARRFCLLLLAPVILLVTGSLLFPSGGRDDAHIGYWVALGLSRFGKIINYNGAAIEQSSTALHAFLLAAAHRLSGGQMEMVLLGRLSAILFGLGAVVLAQRLAHRIDQRLAIPVGLLTASSAYFVYWSFAGMEATLCALLALGLVLLFGDYLAARDEKILSHRLIGIAFLLVAFVLARPEQPLVLFCVLAGAAAIALFPGTKDSEAFRRLLVLAALSTVIVGSLLFWRWATFSSLFPQPVSAKSGSFSAHTVKAGLRYFRKQIILEPGMILLAATAATGAFFVIRERLRNKQSYPHLLIAVLFLVSYGAFVLLAGGDWMEAGRFFVPIIPIAALLAAFALQQLAQDRSRFVLGLAIVLGLAQVFTILHLTARSSCGIPLWSRVSTEPYATESQSFDFSWFERRNRANLRDIPTVRKLDAIVAQLQAARTSGEPIRIMSAQLGMVAYHVVGRHFGKVEILDRRGLVDRKFTSCPLVAHLDRTAGGLQLDYRFYFAHRAEFESECHIPRPDIIFDIGDVPAMPDYTVVYRQTGAVQIDSKRLPGARFAASQFIAVRNDWLSALQPNE